MTMDVADLQKQKQHVSDGDGHGGNGDCDKRDPSLYYQITR